MGSRRHIALRFSAPPRPTLLLVPGILVAVFRPVDSSNGVADPLSPLKTYANYTSHPSPGQTRFNATPNLPYSHLNQHCLPNRCPMVGSVEEVTGLCYALRHKC